ncbi:hypothetical protein [Parasediminibacterium sp. JCM 36343]|uniref:hypothetical protein n=1 Tax=Parasediminibacterium sp. JCM 36343 TaxID=3374279 RepID=UPI003979EB01
MPNCLSNSTYFSLRTFASQPAGFVIVTKEKALLNFAVSPVAIHDIKWFKETFPVPQ